MTKSREKEQKNGGVRCDVCFRHCRIPEGGIGFCRARENEHGRIVCRNAGLITALALDPIEKKPLARFHPGSMVLSVGSYGCNLDCPFCQNFEISRAEGPTHGSRTMASELLADLAVGLKPRGNIGLAFTYNEPLVGWEFVRDTARLVHERGMLNVLVSNGTASRAVSDALIPLLDAVNIDLKCIDAAAVRHVLGGDLDSTKDFIRRAASSGTCHVEITTLIVPGLNDSAEQMREEAAWIASLPGGTEIPLHVTRFFPRYRMEDAGPTPVRTVRALAEEARKTLKYVYTGNC